MQTINNTTLNARLSKQLQNILTKLEAEESRRMLLDMPRSTINHLIDKGISLCARFEAGEQTEDIYLETDIYFDFVALYV